MTEQSKGLRFDIYERIHLADDAIGISELHDTELIPHIQVIEQDEQALLRGNLMLTGQYVGENVRDHRTLEHLIPVEITLPMSRINSLSDILVEIENFDVELLSTRNLNVTGVLSLHGVEVDSGLSLHGAPDADFEQEPIAVDLSLHNPWSEDEEMTFSHQASEAIPASQIPVAYESEVHFHPHVETREEPEIRLEMPQPLQADNFWQQQLHEDVQPEFTYTRALEQYDGYATSYVGTNYEYEVEKQDHNFTNPEYASPALETPAHEEVKEMKVALTSRTKEEPVTEERPVGIKSLLKSSAAQEQVSSQSPPPISQESMRADSLEWRKLFLREDSSQQEFRKVRMCIIQKEDTLEGIARKYGVNERELQNYNSLTNVDVQAGQIIYIPR
ncbi:LysM peptidoglycan-binding domain-containing protein [Paenibacillus albiflavus]|uniref:LysM peptidoglycan-binding domain-containing protein n=1 Tax=Paenibacillus albiflavus TaxID=2545760 RepID=A0A4V2WNE3_9BACL|nr:LysM peptidoglycan-binding domain-containing protein [Paenibacillus albiflavus]TCZ75172.1 LysM peptidoglycan-binding domain-containing protein [Paenibacillus albiflavus]